MATHDTSVGLSTLPPGTVVDGWVVRQVLGRGGGGTVYAAEHVSGRGTGRFALKMASRPQDLRFLREVEVLSRTHHPRVPRLHGHGWWLHPSGASFPYLVIDLIDGVPLYDWASARPPTSRQVLQVLADVASALEATHKAGCVHRDVKGENVLVTAQGYGYLIDFGAGDFQGAAPLTDELLPPGTVYYRSPQALRFQWHHRHQPGAHYEPGPADDVYALGVTGYILVTGSAPQCQVDLQWEADPSSAAPPPPLAPPSALATVSPQLNALVVRMLADEPSLRGSSTQVAQALQQAASRSNSKAEAPILPRPQDSKPPGTRLRPHALRALQLAGAGVCLLLAAYAGWSARAWVSGPRELPHDDAVALGEAGPLAAHLSPADTSHATGLSKDMPKKPLPGQQLPPCIEGFDEVIELTEGQPDTRSCWIKINDKSAAKCKALGYEYKGGCYLPVSPPLKLPQSAKP